MKKRLTLVLCAATILVSHFASFARAEIPVAHNAKVSTDGSSPFAVNVLRFTQLNFGNAGNAKFNAVIQGWSVQNQNSTDKDQHLRLRRTELKLSGTVAHAPKYFFMVDPSRLIVPPQGRPLSTSNMFQDFGLSYSFLPGFELTAGQFKTPTTAEGLDSSVDLPLPERSLVGRTYGDRREMGIKLGYKTSMWSAVSMLSTGKAIYNQGQGGFHDLISRFETYPVKNLSLGAFLTLGNGFDYSKKGRWGVNGRYKWGNSDLRSEYVHAKDGAVHGDGFTAEAGYWISDNFEPVIRHEMFKPNQASHSTGIARTIGFNYHFRNYLSKVQLAASALENMAAVNGSSTFAEGVSNREVTLALQTSI